MLYFTCDHNGFKLKNFLIEKCKESGIEAKDVWTSFDQNDDYPDAATALAKALNSKPKNLEGKSSKKDFGIAICGTGQGICMSLNKFSFVRAGISLDKLVVQKMRQHNDANCLCFPALNEQKEMQKAFKLVEIFIKTENDKAERHLRRINKMTNLAKNQMVN
jgi:ribose 5-phosphate isomerase B